MSLNTTRKVDVLLWGATGFAGQCAAEYLARNYPPGGPHGLSWALGGRNLSRLEAVREELAKISPACKDLLLVVGDSRKQSEIDAAVAQARVVMSTAGPFSEFGTPVVDACVRLGVHYCDITGESQWVRSLIQRYHEQARDSGVFIVPFCGFDSIPSDIGALMMARHMEQKYKRKCASVEYYVTRMRSGGGMAGGTLRSAFALMDQPRSEQRAGMHPYSLNPPDSPKPRVRSDFVLARYSSDLKAWYGTFVMSVVNTRVVRRSVALNSEQFTYQEYMTMGGFFKTLMTSLALSVMLVLTAVPLVRRFIERRLPEPGKGPDKERLKKAYFEGVYVARSDGGNPIVAYGRVRSEMDPGYYETGKMLSESAICLATQMKEILGAGKKGGVLTPASSMGELLLERLRKAKMVFEITDTPKTK